jgi:hypothetical protein
MKKILTLTFCYLTLISLGFAHDEPVVDAGHHRGTAEIDERELKAFKNMNDKDARSQKQEQQDLGSKKKSPVKSEKSQGRPKN